MDFATRLKTLHSMKRIDRVIANLRNRRKVGEKSDKYATSSNAFVHLILTI